MESSGTSARHDDVHGQRALRKPSHVKCRSSGILGGLGSCPRQVGQAVLRTWSYFGVPLSRCSAERSRETSSSSELDQWYRGCEDGAFRAVVASGGHTDACCEQAELLAVSLAAAPVLDDAQLYLLRPCVEDEERLFQTTEVVPEEKRCESVST